FRHYRFPSLAETFPQGELVDAIDPSYPPAGNNIDDTFAGPNADLGRALAEQLALTPRCVMVNLDSAHDAVEAGTSLQALPPRRDVMVNFDSAYDAVEAGTAPLALAALRVDDARMSDIYDTWGYLKDGVMVAALSGIKDGWGLTGMRVGVELGSASHAEARKW